MKGKTSRQKLEMKGLRRRSLGSDPRGVRDRPRGGEARALSFKFLVLLKRGAYGGAGYAGRVEADDAALIGAIHVLAGRANHLGTGGEREGDGRHLAVPGPNKLVTALRPAGENDIDQASAGRGGRRERPEAANDPQQGRGTRHPAGGADLTVVEQPLHAPVHSGLEDVRIRAAASRSNRELRG